MLHADICALTLALNSRIYNEQPHSSKTSLLCYQSEPSSHTLHRPGHCFRPFFDKIQATEEEDTIIAYDMAASPHFRFMAEQITSKKTGGSRCMAFYTLNSLPKKPNPEILWTTLPPKDATDLFSELQKQYLKIFNVLVEQHKNKEKSLEKNKSVKTCTKIDDSVSEMRITKYTQEEHGIKRIAERVCMYHGRKYYASNSDGSKKMRCRKTSEALFEELEDIYLNENKPSQ
ncbi:MAG: hypothetical protein ACHQVS_03840 [Candidatus Babeliales bacterium]